MTLPIALPSALKRRLLRCAMSALKDAGASQVSSTITPAGLVLEAAVPGAPQPAHDDEGV